MKRTMEEGRKTDTGGSAVARGPGVDHFRGRSRLERAVLPYVREPTLWPVLVAVLVHAIALVAPLLVFTLRDGSRWALTGLLVVLGLTGLATAFELRDRGRPGNVTAVLASAWALCAGGAWAAVRTGIL